MIYQATIWSYNAGSDPDSLAHYASPYYDPVKAHEYYMRTRQLKGRKSVAGLSGTQRETAAYVKEQLSEERKSKTEALKSEAESSANKHKAEMQREIATLRAKFKGMSKEERAENRGEMQREISRLRSLNAYRRKLIMQQYAVDAEGLKTEYDQMYEDELDKIRAESAAKTSSSKTRSKKGTYIVGKDDRAKKGSAWMRERLTQPTFSKTGTANKKAVPAKNRARLETDKRRLRYT